MSKLKILIAIILGLIFTTIIVAFFIPETTRMPLSHLVLKLVAHQTQSGELSLEQISLENLYPSDYKISFKENYYTIKILSKDNEELFSGQVLKKQIIPPAETGDFFETTHNFVGEGLTEKSIEEILVYLPYYKQAQKVIFLDEDGKEKLTVQLNDLKLPENYSKKLCGNGICDFNENLFSCFSDCGFRK